MNNNEFDVGVKFRLIVVPYNTAMKSAPYIIAAIQDELENYELNPQEIFQFIFFINKKLRKSIKHLDAYFSALSDRFPENILISVEELPPKSKTGLEPEFSQEIIEKYEKYLHESWEQFNNKNNI